MHLLNDYHNGACKIKFRVSTLLPYIKSKKIASNPILCRSIEKSVSISYFCKQLKQYNSTFDKK